MPDRPRVVLCDLDDTLFDHAGATRDALAIVRGETPALAAWSLDVVDARHRVLLEALHLEVLAGRVAVEAARVERFRRLLVEAGADNHAELAVEIAATYRHAYESAWRGVEGALALARAIKALGISLIIVTNNGVEEQRLKLDRCDFATTIDALVTSEEFGMAKPRAEIFAHALERAGATPDEAVMLGDAWGTDIEGALAAGIRPVWFNPAGIASPDPAVAEIRALTPTAAALAVLLRGST